MSANDYVCSVQAGITHAVSPLVACRSRASSLTRCVDGGMPRLPQTPGPCFNIAYARSTDELSFAAFILQSPMEYVWVRSSIPTAFPYEVEDQRIPLLCGRGSVVMLCGSFRSASGRRPATQEARLGCLSQLSSFSRRFRLWEQRASSLQPFRSTLETKASFFFVEEGPKSWGSVGASAVPQAGVRLRSLPQISPASRRRLCCLGWQQLAATCSSLQQLAAACRIKPSLTHTGFYAIRLCTSRCLNQKCVLEKIVRLRRGPSLTQQQRIHIGTSGRGGGPMLKSVPPLFNIGFHSSRLN